jgi:hypothetical protein
MQMRLLGITNADFDVIGQRLITFFYICQILENKWGMFNIRYGLKQGNEGKRRPTRSEIGNKCVSAENKRRPG